MIFFGLTPLCKNFCGHPYEGQKFSGSEINENRRFYTNISFSGCVLRRNIVPCILFGNFLSADFFCVSYFKEGGGGWKARPLFCPLEVLRPGRINILLVEVAIDGGGGGRKGEDMFYVGSIQRDVNILLNRRVSRIF